MAASLFRSPDDGRFRDSRCYGSDRSDSVRDRKINAIRGAALNVPQLVSIPDILSQLESECEKERYRAEIGSLVTFVKAGVSNWSRDFAPRSVNLDVASSRLLMDPWTEST